MNALLLPSWTLLRREITRFYRDRSRVIGALVPPIVFWFLIGSGLGGSYYLCFLFPGTLVLIVLFTSIFSMISVIEDRREGFLQGVLVAPVSRMSIVLGKVLGGTALGFLQGLAFLILSPTIGISLRLSSLPLVLSALALIAFGLAGLGFLLAWKLESTQGFHAIMNLFLIPMWLLSGATFAVAGAPRWLGVVIAVNPVSYAVSALQSGLLADPRTLAGPGFSIAVLLAFSAAILLLSSWAVGRPSRT